MQATAIKLHTLKDAAKNGGKALHTVDFWAHKVKTERTWDFSLRRKKRPGDEICKGIDQIFNTYHEEEGWLREDKEGISKPGTATVFARVKSCALKGCLSDPVPIDEMYDLVGYTKEFALPEYRCKGGSGKNESLHGAINAWMSGISNISEDKMQRHITLFLYEYNQKLDVLNGVCDAGPGYAFEMLEANAKAEGLGMLPPFPICASGGLELNGDGFLLDETFGFEYYRQWQQQQRSEELQALVSTSRPVSDGAHVSASASASDSSERGHDGKAARNHRVPVPQYAPLIADDCVDITTKDEAMLVSICVAEVTTEKPKLKKTGPFFERAERKYLARLLENSRLGVDDRDHQWSDLCPELRGKLQLCGRIEKGAMEAAYQKAASEANQNRLSAATAPASQAPALAILGPPLPSLDQPTQVAPPQTLATATATPMQLVDTSKKSKKRKRVRVASLIDNCTTLHRRSKNVFALGSDFAHILGATNVNEDLGDDIEVMLAYVRNMKKTLPKGKKTELATGARMAYEKHKVHLWGQLEKFFAEFNGGQSTYTPRTV